MSEDVYELPEPLDFDQVVELFRDLKSQASPSELHGQLCGYLSAGASFTNEQWLKLASDFMGLEQVPGGILGAVLEEFYQVTEAWLTSGSMAFQMLLADEDCPVEERLMSLGDWCSGFLAGFALSGKTAGRAFSTETEETLKDLAAIAQVGLDEEEEELDEASWFEITEYVRMAAMSLYYEQSPEAAAPVSKQVH